MSICPFPLELLKKRPLQKGAGAFSALMGEAVDDLLHLAAAGSALCPINKFLALGLGEGGISVHGRLILGDGHKKTNGCVGHNYHLFRVYTEYSTKRVKYAHSQAV